MNQQASGDSSEERLALKDRVRETLQRTKAGASAYFVYGKLRQLPSSTALFVDGYLGRRKVRSGASVEPDAPLDLQWAAVLGKSERWLPLPENAGRQRVLFATANGFNPFVTGLHSMMAVALQLRGFRAEFMACDKALPASDWNINGNWDPSPTLHAPPLPRALGLSRCRYCTSGLTKTYEQLGLPIRTMSEFAEPSMAHVYWEELSALPVSEVKEKTHHGVPVGKHGYSTAVRLLMTAELDEASEREAWFARRSVLGSMVASDVLSRLLDRYRPDSIVMNHGIYLTHGVLVDVATQKDIRVVVHEWSDRKNTFIWSHDKSTHYELVDEPIERWEDLEVSPADDARLEEYLSSKRHSSMDWLVHHPNPVEDRVRIRSELGLTEMDRVVACFTNVMWDAQIYYESLAYDNMLDWLMHTYELARANPGIKVVIREHPGEARIWGRPGQRIRDEIEGRTSTPENVIWIMAESDISSYTVAEMSDLSVVYGTKLGLELAATGSPVVIVGNAFARGKGFTYDVGERADYEHFFSRAGDLDPSPESVARARRYAFHYYFRRVMDIPYITMENPAKGTKAKLGFENIGQLMPGENEGLDRICTGVMTGMPFESVATRLG